MTLSRDGERAYLVSDDRVTVLGTRALDVLGEVTVTKNPSCVLESPDGSHLYVADYSGVLTAARIDSGQTPHSGDADHPDATAAGCSMCPSGSRRWPSRLHCGTARRPECVNPRPRV